MTRDLSLCVFFGLLSVISYTNAAVYSDQWAVNIEGEPQVADEIAGKHGFSNLGQIIPNYYHFVNRRIAKRSVDINVEHHQKLLQEPNVKWARQQVVKTRVKRDFRELRAVTTTLNDPRWPQMWYLNRGRELDMNVEVAWAKGVTGKGVVVTILDDGLEKDHPDLRRNYDALASYDVNNHDDDPQPRYDMIDSNRHGTRCAGEVAADANNSICAVGVAYDASVGGVRMLDGDVTDAVEARSLSLKNMHIDIYSASWGPDDDGKTVDGPGELATRAFIEGVMHGRNGLGSIFVWASGNGGRDHDNCNCDGYTNSIWTLSISSATENGLVPWYSEACSSTLATTYSSGSSGEKQVVTTDLHHGCTSTHTGTSASAPLAAGICALALQVNRRLTWRDMQHIVVRSARPSNLKSQDWQINGVGRNVSHSFGYGLMDAAAMVDLAKDWITVPDQKTCEVRTPQRDKLIPAKSEVKLQVLVDCPRVRFLEHVQAKITLSATRRGDIQVFLISPLRTRSTLLAIRPQDNSRQGFQAWPFMTVHSWGENPAGLWTLEIHNEGRYQASISDWNLILYGTEENPDRKKTGAPVPSSSCLRTSPSGTCLECEIGFLLDNTTCIATACPESTFRITASQDSSSHRCFPCHYSCRLCVGPNDYDCSSCFGDGSLDENGYCYPLKLKIALQLSYRWQLGMIVVFFFMALVIIVLVIAIVVLKTAQKNATTYSKLSNYDNCAFSNSVKPFTDQDDAVGSDEEM